MGDFIRGSDFPKEIEPHLIKKIQILSSLESDPDFLNSKSVYYDRESNKKFYMGKKLLKNDELKNQVHQWLKKIENQAKEEGIEYISLNDKSSIENYRQFVFGVL